MLINNYAISFLFNADKLSIYFVILTMFIIPICVFAALKTTKNPFLFVAYLLMIKIFLVISFLTTNLVIFYIFFESVLIPMFLMVNQWGSRTRKIKAGFYLFLYTLFGSFFLLWAIFYLYVITGSVNYNTIFNINYSVFDQKILWLFFFFPFAIKTPLYPFHIWLPEAHVEAPTIGSVILASLLLKLGGYGFIRIMLPITADNLTFIPLIYSLALCGIIFGSLTTIIQIDLKKLIAYSSVAHMSLIVLGIFSFNIYGVYGAVYLMVAHAFVSSGLFFCIGVLYDRHHTRLIRYYGGLVQVMPVFSVLLFLLTLSNMSFPGTANFIGELLILNGISHSTALQTNLFILPLAATGIVLSAIYSIYLYNRIIFGAIKIKYILSFRDLSRAELLILIPLIIMIFLLGITNSFL